VKRQILVGTCATIPIPHLRGAPSGHVINIREVRLAAGAEFVVMVCATS
jgi:formyltetrahydrofolate synthetase